MTELGWHIIQNGNKMSYRKDFTIREGQTVRIFKEPVPCKRGFHACKDPFECSWYIVVELNSYLCRVEVGGIIREQDTKFCGQTRKVWWMRHYLSLIREFCASDPNELYSSSGRVYHCTKSRPKTVREFNKWLWEVKRLPVTRPQYKIWLKEQKNARIKSSRV